MILPIITWFVGPLHFVLSNTLKVTPHTQPCLFQITNGDHCKQACVSGFTKTCITLNKGECLTILCSTIEIDLVWLDFVFCSTNRTKD